MEHYNRNIEQRQEFLALPTNMWYINNIINIFKPCTLEIPHCLALMTATDTLFISQVEEGSGGGSGPLWQPSVFVPADS